MFTYTTINGSNAIRAHQAFRYTLFHNVGFIEDHPEALDIDGYDEYSDHFFVYDEDKKPVACSRLTYLGKCSNTYTDRFVKNPPYPCQNRNKIAEINRFGIAPACRGLKISFELHFRLLLRISQTAKESGVEYLITGVHEGYWNLIRVQKKKKNPFREHPEVQFKEFEGYKGYVEANTEPLVFLSMKVQDYLDRFPISF